MGDQQTSESTGDSPALIFEALARLEIAERKVDEVKEICLSLDRLAEIFFEGQEAFRAARKVIVANHSYSSRFGAYEFLYVAAGYAFAKTFDIDIMPHSPDEILALGDMLRFIEELRYQIKASEERGAVSTYVH